MIITLENMKRLKPGNKIVFVKNQTRKPRDLTPGNRYVIELFEGIGLYIRDDANDARWIESMINSYNVFKIINMSMVNK